MSVGGVSGAGGGHMPQLPPQVMQDLHQVEATVGDILHEKKVGNPVSSHLYHNAMEATGKLIANLQKNRTEVVKDLALVADLLFVVLELGSEGQYTSAQMLSSFEQGLKEITLGKMGKTKKKELELLAANTAAAVKASNDLKHAFDDVKSDGSNLAQTLNSTIKSASELSQATENLTNDTTPLPALHTNLASLHNEVSQTSSQLAQAKTDATNFQKTMEQVHAEALKRPGKINSAIDDLNQFNTAIQNTPLHAQLEPLINKTLNHLNTSLDYAYISLNSFKAIVKQLENIATGKSQNNQQN